MQPCRICRSITKLLYRIRFGRPQANLIRSLLEFRCLNVIIKARQRCGNICQRIEHLGVVVTERTLLNFQNVSLDRLRFFVTPEISAGIRQPGKLGFRMETTTSPWVQ